MRREALDLIVHPENALGAGHGGNIRRRDGEGTENAPSSTSAFPFPAPGIISSRDVSRLPLLPTSSWCASARSGTFSSRRRCCAPSAAVHPGARVTMLTKAQYVPLVSHNPHVSEVFGITPQDTVRSVSRAHQARPVLPSVGPPGRDAHLAAPVAGPRAPGPASRTAASPASCSSGSSTTTTTSTCRYRSATSRRPPIWGSSPTAPAAEFFLNPFAEENAAGWLTRAGIGTKRALVAISPGAAHATKRWPVEHWIKLCRQIVHTGADIVALGGPGGLGGGRRDRGARRGPAWRAPPAS